ncbi:histidine phosphatase family protein [Polymorphospora rubra]|uniref:Phosphoglycerate mutase n=1 Tax=Polymorphospora rubra TaxID=338584 RepID=A0A810MW74_9ACTN|nr:phosphoglycerate mutase [Polymorphospora rubra]
MPDVRFAELTVVRHGQSEANAAFAAAAATGALDSGITGRDADVALSPTGRGQAAALGRWLAGQPAGHRPEAVVCSPYRRAVQTWDLARAAADGLGVRLPAATTDGRLGDRVMGELELLTGAAIAARFPAEAARRRDLGEFRYRPPGGESFGDIAARLAAVLADLEPRYAGRRVWLVAHDSVVLMLRHLVEGLTFDDLAAVVAAGPVANASITRFRAGLGRPVEYNGVSHLEDGSIQG